MRVWLLASVVLAGCNVPAWATRAPNLQREAAYDWLVVAPGDARAERREIACEQAHARAFEGVRTLFVATYKDQSDIVAAAGGPARVERVLTEFANDVGRVAAQTTALFYDDALRHCYVELSWFLPRPLAQAVRRNLESLATEEGVALELSRALASPESDAERTPVSPAKGPPQRASVAEAVSAIYPGWYVRFVTLPSCPEASLAFVGAPGGGESRWLWLRAEEGGFRVAKDEKLRADDWSWPTPPAEACRQEP